MCFIQKMLCFQDSLYNEDYLGLRLREKDQEIVQLKEDNAVKLQQLVQAQSQLHSVESMVWVKNCEITVSLVWSWCV